MLYGNVYWCCSYEPSQADVSMFEALGAEPASQFVHAVRWYKHISSYGADMKRWLLQLTVCIVRCYFPSLWTDKCKARALFSVHGRAVNWHPVYRKLVLKPETGFKIQKPVVRFCYNHSPISDNCHCRQSLTPLVKERMHYSSRSSSVSRWREGGRGSNQRAASCIMTADLINT